MINTITFDLWNTLISNTAEDARRFRRLRIQGMIEAFLAEGVNVEKEKVEKAHDITFERCWDLWGKNLDCSSEEQIRILADSLPDFGENPPPDLLKRLKKAYTESVLESPSELIEGSSEVLKHLKSQRYKLGLICNTGRSPGKVLRKLMEHYQILEHFDALSFSDELRIRKPDPEIFLYTLKNLKSIASDSVHVGDELLTDVKGAKDAGMMSIHLSKTYSTDQGIQPDYCIRKLKEIKEIAEELRDT